MRVDRAKLRSLDACGSDLQKFLAAFGEGGLEPSWETFEQAYALGVNLIWFYTNVIPPTKRAEFVAETLAARQPGVEALAGGKVPTGLKAAAQTAREKWRREEHVASKAVAVALEDMDADRALSEPTPEDCQQAARHALRATSMAGLEEEPVKRRLCEWLARAWEDAGWPMPVSS